MINPQTQTPAPTPTQPYPHGSRGPEPFWAAYIRKLESDLAVMIEENGRLRNLTGLQAVRTASLTDHGDVACPSVLVPIPDHIWEHGIFEFDPNHPEYGIDAEGRKCLALDACIVPAVLALWVAGIETRSCCCGHGSGWGIVTIYSDCLALAITGTGVEVDG